MIYGVIHFSLSLSLSIGNIFSIIFPFKKKKTHTYTLKNQVEC